MKTVKLFVLLSGVLLLFAGCAGRDDASRLHALFDKEWEFRLKENPLFATSVGRHEWDYRLPSVTKQDQQRRAQFWRGLLGELKTIRRDRLASPERINYDIFKRLLEDRIAEYEFGTYEIPLTADSGFHIAFSRLPQQMPFATAADYENYISRLQAFPEYVRQQIAVMRDGLKRGMTLPKVVLKGYDVTIRSHVVDDPTKSVFFAPFRSFPATMPQSERQSLTKAGKAAIMEGAVSGYREFLKFMVDEYIPNARSTTAAADLPRGREYYQYLVRHYTTLDVTPEEVHEIGLAEVARIHKEMMQIIRQVKFRGDFKAFLRFLRTDPRFYAKTPLELLKDASYIAKRMDGKLPSLFKTLPRLPYGIEPVPASIAPKYTAGRYVEPPYGSTRAGTYLVNTYALNSRPLYALEALTLHEAVPGHHLQIALARELTNLPNFRRFLYLPAFGEGWGLYAERLGLEVGFYQDPYSNFGRLTYEMWRACRLVVDTGLHAMGWTRQQAMDYMAANTALSLHEIETETDRYISWPGQALAYKMGELKIRDLRRQAEKALGRKFDLREFHDTVLLNGSVPLPVLEELVQEYIEAAKAREAS